MCDYQLSHNSVGILQILHLTKIHNTFQYIMPLVSGPPRPLLGRKISQLGQRLHGDAPANTQTFLCVFSVVFVPFTRAESSLRL